MSFMRRADVQHTLGIDEDGRHNDSINIKICVDGISQTNGTDITIYMRTQDRVWILIQLTWQEILRLSYNFGTLQRKHY